MKNRLSFLLIPFLTLATVLPACRLGPVSLSQWQAPPDPTPTPLRYDIKVNSPDSGLAELESYRSHLIVRFEGVRNGQPTGGQIESLTEINRDPPARRQYLKARVITPTLHINSGISEFYQVEETVYAKKAGDSAWFTVIKPNDDQNQITPEELGFLQLNRLIILPLTVSTAPQSETLNGLDVRHYRFTERDLPSGDLLFEQAQGDLWIAAHGNFLMQYVISATVRLVTPLPQAHIFDQGQLNLRYTVTDVNQPVKITPPDLKTVLRESQVNRLPRLPDAELITLFPTLIEYTSAISSISATLFYRDQLNTLGWTESDSSEIFTEKARLHFSREGERLTVIISPAGNPEKIEVLLDLVALH